MYIDAKKIEQIFNMLPQEVQEHSIRMANYAQIIAKYVPQIESLYNINYNALLNSIYFGALFHDIGKVKIPIKILSKKGELSEQ